MTEKPKSLEEIAATVLSDENIEKAVADTQPLPRVFTKGEVVNWQGKAAVVNQVIGEAVEIAITEYVTVKGSDLR